MRLANRHGVCSTALLLSFLIRPTIAQNRANPASGDELWIPSWVAAPQPARPPQPIRIPNAPAQSQAAPPASAARPPAPIVSLNNQTVRMIVHTSIGGGRVRIRLSNAYGTAALKIGAAHIALRDKNSSIVAGSDRTFMFGGKSSISIPPLALVVSDPVNLTVPALGDVAVSIYLPGDTGPATLHSVGLHTTYISKEGDETAQLEIEAPATSQSWFFLSGLEVVAPPNAAAVVTFGDSITDGTRSTPNTDSSWPNFLARRLQANPATANIAVLNEGISANRVLQDGIGAAGLARFDRDVLSQPRVKWVTILEGINDIGAGIGPAFIFGPHPDSPASDEPTADDLIGGYRQMIERAHTQGIKVIGCTLTPFEGAAYYSEQGNKVRKEVNEWIRSSGSFDAVIDFEAAVRSTENPNKFRPEFDSGDHLHPNDAGYKVMADAVDLSVFVSGQPKRRK